MKKIAVLGPSGTYSDIAAKQYLKNNNLDLEIVYYPSILRTINAVSEDTIAIVPFENTLDGFVFESLDGIIARNLHIASQSKLSIDFAFVSNNKNISDIKNVYCQFKAYGQCLDFITNNNLNILRTQSNTESLELINNSDDSYGAIIPVHTLYNNKYNIEMLHIADSQHNETRFFIIEDAPSYNKLGSAVEASVVVTATKDRPGLLFDILKEFHELDINLKSILSRPMKTEMGKYKFYIECSLTNDQIHLLDDVKKNLKDYIVDILGIYNAI